MTATVLVVDDDPVQRRLLDAMLRRFGYDVVAAESGDEALKLCSAGEGERFDAVVLDLVMPDLDGMGVLARAARARHRDPGHRADGAWLDRDGGLGDARRRGRFRGQAGRRRAAADLDQERAEARRARTRAAPHQAPRRRHARLPRPRHQERRTWPASSRLAERAAKSNIPILVEGESGVGKEVLARAIQGSSDRKGKPFVTVNCGAIPHNLVESILFGHEKGAFTGATERHVGKFVEAHGGTLFLDEVGELPLDAQVKLLRAIQEGEVDPVGGKKSVRVDIRIISATNKSLLEQVKRGEFREDLYYRLNVFPITLPPLRQRREDIADLARGFLARFAAEEGKKLRGIAAEALALLGGYDWPGNVRQLENAMFRAVVLADGDELTVAEFPQIAAQMEGFDVRIPPAPAPLARSRGAATSRRRGSSRCRCATRTRWSSSPAPTCASSTSWSARSSNSRWRITAGTCPRSRASSASAARRSIASSRITG